MVDTALSNSHNLMWISSRKIYGHIFFNPENGQAITVTSVSYLEMLKEIFPDDVSTDPDEFSQQDSATAHTCTASLAWLENRFSGKIIPNSSSYKTVKWSAYPGTHTRRKTVKSIWI